MKRLSVVIQIRIMLGMIFMLLSKERCRLAKRRLKNTPLTCAIATLYAYLGEYQKADQEVTAFLERAESWEEKQMGRSWLFALLPYTGQYARALREIKIAKR